MLETDKKFFLFLFFEMGLEKQLSTFIYQDLSAVLPPVSAAVLISDSVELHGPLLVLINKLQTHVLRSSPFVFVDAFLHLINDENAASLGLWFAPLFMLYLD